MSEQGALAAVRRAIRDWGAAKFGEGEAYEVGAGAMILRADAALAEAQAGLDATLAAAEARIGRLERERAEFVRFVRADDAVRRAWSDPWQRGATTAENEKTAARAALTAEDLGVDR